MYKKGQSFKTKMYSNLKTTTQCIPKQAKYLEKVIKSRKIWGVKFHCL